MGKFSYDEFLLLNYEIFKYSGNIRIRSGSIFVVFVDNPHKQIYILNNNKNFK